MQTIHQADDFAACHTCDAFVRTQILWWQWGTTLPTAELCSIFIKETSSDCSTWMGWRPVSCTRNSMRTYQGHVLVSRPVFCFLWALHSISLFFMPCLSYVVCLHMSVCGVWVFRQTLRLHSEEEGRASGGVKERHPWVWWVQQGSYSLGDLLCVCLHCCFLHVFWFGVALEELPCSCLIKENWRFALS